MGVGGNGSGGGIGGNVTLQVNAQALDVATTGLGSDGILLQSVGGGGGAGGSALAGGAFYALTVGGSGGTGGNAGSIAMQTGSDPIRVQTSGYGANGVAAESVGGGGGLADWSVSAAAGSISASQTIGGSGGGAGSSGIVDLQLAGSIETMGGDAVGLLGQSIGGGGGDAGLSLATNAGHHRLDRPPRSAAQAAAAASGGSVILTTATGSSIVTAGNDSPGMLAQSIGGGGGDSGTTIAGAGALSGSIAVAGRRYCGKRRRLQHLAHLLQRQRCHRRRRFAGRIGTIHRGAAAATAALR